MTCPRCGFAGDDQATFCLNCGTRLSPPTQDDAPSLEAEEKTPSSEMPPVLSEPSTPSESPAIPSDDGVPPPPYQRADAAYRPLTPPARQQPPVAPPPPPPFGAMPPADEPVSVWKWLGLMVIESFVSVAHLVLMFIYAFSSTTSKSLKNYSRAKLILAAIKLVFGIVLFCLAFSAIMEFVEMVIYYSYTYPM